jgi:hypothetical protein
MKNFLPETGSNLGVDYGMIILCDVYGMVYIIPREVDRYNEGQ